MPISSSSMFDLICWVGRNDSAPSGRTFSIEDFDSGTFFEVSDSGVVACGGRFVTDTSVEPQFSVGVPIPVGASMTSSVVAFQREVSGSPSDLLTVAGTGLTNATPLDLVLRASTTAPPGAAVDGLTYWHDTGTGWELRVYRGGSWRSFPAT